MRIYFFHRVFSYRLSNILLNIKVTTINQKYDRFNSTIKLLNLFQNKKKTCFRCLELIFSADVDIELMIKYLILILLIYDF